MAKQTINKIGNTPSTIDVETALGISAQGDAAKVLNEQGDFISAGGADKSLLDYINEIDMTPPEYGFCVLVSNIDQFYKYPIAGFSTSMFYTLTIRNGDGLIVKKYDENNNIIDTVIWADDPLALPKITFDGLNCINTPYGDIYKLTYEPNNTANPITALQFKNVTPIIAVEFGVHCFDAITTAISIFETTTSLIKVVIQSFGTITSMEKAFYSCKLLESITLPADGHLITTMNSMCYYNYSLKSLTLPTDLSGLLDMASICNGAQELTVLTLPALPLVTTTSLAFALCYKLTGLVMPATMDALTTINMMCYYCIELTSLTLPTSMAALITMDGFIRYCYKLGTLGECVTFKNAQTSCYNATINKMPLTIFKQLFKASVFALKGYSLIGKTALTSIDIDYANSLFAGASPQIDFGYNALPAAELERIFGLLPYIAVGKTMAITGNVGADTLISKANSGAVANSINVTIANTSSLAVGMEVYGTGIDTAIACTVETNVDTITKVGHGLTNGMIVSFATIVTSTNFTVYRPYYVVNKTDNTFQIEATVGGGAIDLTGSNGSGTYLTQPTIASIDENVKIVLDRPASATGTVTVTAGVLKRSIAKFKKWTLTN